MPVGIPHSKPYTNYCTKHLVEALIFPSMTGAIVRTQSVSSPYMRQLSKCFDAENSLPQRNTTWCRMARPWASPALVGRIVDFSYMFTVVHCSINASSHWFSSKQLVSWKEQVVQVHINIHFANKGCTPKPTSASWFDAWWPPSANFLRCLKDYAWQARLCSDLAYVWCWTVTCSCRLLNSWVII